MHLAEKAGKDVLKQMPLLESKFNSEIDICLALSIATYNRNPIFEHETKKLMPQCLVTNKQEFSSPLTESVLTHILNLSMKYGCKAKGKFNKDKYMGKRWM